MCISIDDKKHYDLVVSGSEWFGKPALKLCQIKGIHLKPVEICFNLLNLNSASDFD